MDNKKTITIYDNQFLVSKSHKALHYGYLHELKQFLMGFGKTSIVDYQ